MKLDGSDLELDALKRAFFAAHEMSYGYSNPTDPVEVVNFRLTTKGRLPRPSESPVASTAAGTPEAIEVRPVWFATNAPVDTPVYDRERLFPGLVLQGPAVIEQLDATTLLYPRDRLTVDPSLNLLIELAP